MRTLEFWYEFASTYSYPCAMRIEPVAREFGVTVIWRPFLLGPIFASAGWTDSPFNYFPVKRRYMQRDLERTCHRLGLRFFMPAPFPQNGLLAARAATAIDNALVSDFTKAVYRTEFERGQNIADAATIRPILSELGLEPAAWLERAGRDETKQRLRERTAEAAASGIFGAPTLKTPDGELFWGNDRLEEALKWVGRT